MRSTACSSSSDSLATGRSRRLTARSLPSQNPFRPASDPSVLRATPALTPSSVHMPLQQPQGEEEVARETAGEFTAAAARARQPDHQAYEQAEHQAGLAGQGAQVGPLRPRPPPVGFLRSLVQVWL